MADADRVQFNAEGNWSDILTEDVKGLVASLQDEFGERIAGLREARIDMIDAAVKRGMQPVISLRAQPQRATGPSRICPMSYGIQVSKYLARRT